MLFCGGFRPAGRVRFLLFFGRIPPSADGGLLCPRRLVVAKSTQLRFHLTAKTAFVPLLLLFPANPLRWASPGDTGEIYQNAAGGRRRGELRSPMTAFPRTPVTGALSRSGAKPFRRAKSEWHSAISSGPTGALAVWKIGAGAVPFVRLALPNQWDRPLRGKRSFPHFRRRGGPCGRPHFPAGIRREAQGPPLPDSAVVSLVS